MPSTHIIRDRQTEVLAAIALIVAGSYLLHDAYEKRGKRRPFATKLLPGP